MKLNNKLLYILSYSIGTMILMSSCDEEDLFGDRPLPPVADFTYTADADDSFTINFNNTSLNATSYLWDFGDGNTSTEASPSYTFSSSGEQMVNLIIESEDSRDRITKPVLVESPGGIPTGPNILAGPNMDDPDAWTVHAGAPLVIDFEFRSDGSLFFSGEAATEETYQLQVWQPVELVADIEYLLAADISGGGFNNAYFEVNLGSAMPVDGENYTPECPTCVEGIGGGNSKVIGMNFWAGCGEESFEGNIVELGCDGPAQVPDPDNPDDTNTGGRIMVSESGTYYVVLKAGTWNGTMGQGVAVNQVFLAEIVE